MAKMIFKIGKMILKIGNIIKSRESHFKIGPMNFKMWNMILKIGKIIKSRENHFEMWPIIFKMANMILNIGKIIEEMVKIIKKEGRSFRIEVRDFKKVPIIFLNGENNFKNRENN